ncbi:MAG: hypothetical protein JWR18_1727 [Segetibacter sp.]|nr:hypothetical protein [Segetibacter sp.]
MTLGIESKGCNKTDSQKRQNLFSKQDFPNNYKIYRKGNMVPEVAVCDATMLIKKLLEGNKK